MRKSIGIVATVLAVACGGATGCKKDEPAAATTTTATTAVAEKPASEKGTAAATTSAPATATTSAAPVATTTVAASGPYAAGEVLQHVPEKCASIGMFFDVARLMKDAGPAFAKLDEKLAEAVKGDEGEKLEKAIAAIKQSGVNPGQDIKELAVCSQENRHATVVTVGGNFGGKDILGALQKATEASQNTATRKDDAGMAYLVTKDGHAFGLVAPNVLVMAETEALLKDMRKPQDRAAAWGAAGHVMRHRIVVDDGQVVDVDVKDNAGSYDVATTISLTGKALEGLKKAPDQVKAAIQQKLGQAIREMEASPAKSVAADLKAAKIATDADKGQVLVTFSMPSAHMADVFKAITEGAESALEQHASKAHDAIKPAVAKCAPGQARIVGVKPGGVCVPSCDKSRDDSACPAGKVCKVYPTVQDDGSRSGTEFVCLSKHAAAGVNKDCRNSPCGAGSVCNVTTGECVVNNNE